MAEVNVPLDAAGARLDAWLTGAVPGLSRSRWQALIRDERVAVDGRPCRPSTMLHGGECIQYRIPPPEPVALEPEAIALDVLYEDSALIAVNKPPGLVVHPAPGHTRGTLVHALLHHCGDLAGVGGQLRPGIVHRLDKDTSGVLVAAKTEPAMLSLAGQFKDRRVRKEYLALVAGVPVPAAGTIDTLIARSERHRKKMDVHPTRGKRALTHYRVEHAYPGAALVRLHIETGRTHQIRVHMAHIGHPVLGDALYGGRRREGMPRPLRQMLHAEVLAFLHPLTGEPLSITAPWPDDLRLLIRQLAHDAHA
jgi:23S rRNA pseudouridine1911/1915/1917 synthase